MKTMKCNQLGGPSTCEVEFHAEKWEDMKNQSMKHGHEMFEKKDQEHLKAMGAMKEKMSDPKAMQAWMSQKEKEFEEMPEDE
jgi:hypothetical protein